MKDMSNCMPRGELQGDTKAMPVSKASTDGGANMAKSTDGVSLSEGFKPMGSIAGDTQSDKGWA